jgi:hypothetical protein
MTSTLVTRYMEALQDRLGLDAVAESDHHISISKAEGVYHLLLDADHDPEFLGMLVSVPRPEGDLSDDDLCRLANVANAAHKGAYVTIRDEGRIVIEVGMLVAAPNCLPTADHLAGVLPRAMSMIRATAGRFGMEVSVHEMERQLNQ